MELQIPRVIIDAVCDGDKAIKYKEVNASREYLTIERLINNK